MTESDAADRDRRGPYEILAVASSAGGIAALSHLLGGLPASFPLPVVVVQHLDRRHETIIAQILARRTALTTRLAEAGDRVEAGSVYIAPPDRHLLVGADGRVSLSSSELVHFVRPAADLLFESVASSYSQAALACVLTGSGADGATGATAIHARGGTVIVEDPEHADFKGMPEAAIAAGAADLILPLNEIPQAICGLLEVPRS